MTLKWKLYMITRGVSAHAQRTTMAPTITIKNTFRHLGKIFKHKYWVFYYCCKAGIPWRGVKHDMSKFSPTEFWESVRYYQGTSSPIDACKKDKGISMAWMHHKGRNRHHYEYWTDMSRQTRCYESVIMPRKYLVEMVMDRRAACMVYQGKDYTDGSALAYFAKSRERELMHPETKRQLQYILTMLQDSGEKQTFRYMKQQVLRGEPFPWEKEE